MNTAMNAQLAQPKITPMYPGIHKADEAEEGPNPPTAPLNTLLGNDAVKSYITRHESEILEHFELVVNTVSMEEAVQQHLEADGEFEESPEEGEAPTQ